MPKSSKPPRRHPGTAPKNHPKSTRWAVDFDYLHKLTPAEQRWLGKFADGHYKADPRCMPGYTPKEKREAFRRKNAANRDLYTADWKPPQELGSENGWSMEDPREPAPANPQSDPAVVNWEQTPEYLDSPEYKEALEEFRDTLPPFEGRLPKETPKFKKARRKLRGLIPEGE